ncbi:hypothetical protein ABKN59_003630 [Abortiporus biennis]
MSSYSDYIWIQAPPSTAIRHLRIMHHPKMLTIWPSDTCAQHPATLKIKAITRFDWQFPAPVPPSSNGVVKIYDPNLLSLGIVPRLIVLIQTEGTIMRVCCVTALENKNLSSEHPISLFLTSSSLTSSSFSLFLHPPRSFWLCWCTVVILYSHSIEFLDPTLT